MAAIPNSKPITPATADKLWVTSLMLTPQSLRAVLAPWDGTYLAGNPSDQNVVLAHYSRDAAAKAVADAVVAQLARLANQPAETFAVLNVLAGDPTKAVRAEVTFRTGTTACVRHVIADLFAALAADAALAGVYADAMTFLAGKAV